MPIIEYTYNVLPVLAGFSLANTGIITQGKIENLRICAPDIRNGPKVAISKFVSAISIKVWKHVREVLPVRSIHCSATLFSMVSNAVVQVDSASCQPPTLIVKLRRSRIHYDDSWQKSIIVLFRAPLKDRRLRFLFFVMYSRYRSSTETQYNKHAYIILVNRNFRAIMPSITTATETFYDLSLVTLQTQLKRFRKIFLLHIHSEICTSAIKQAVEHWILLQNKFSQIN